MKRKNILKEACILLIAAALIFSSVAMANIQTKQTQITLNTTHKDYGEEARGAIVWDNYMWYEGLLEAQLDDLYPLEAEPADDFQFDTTTEVCDVHWVGGYWGDNYSTSHWPWEITFYYDNGSGEKPGDVYIGSLTFNDTEYTEVLIEDTGSSIYYEFSVDLPENYEFPGDQKFWIVIRGVGFYPPQSGWAYHEDPILLHEAVFRSEWLGFPDWTNVSDPDLLNGTKADMCFQLTTKSLVADADGPYEAYVGEDIHFQGSASGGTPPYSFYWDFGNGYSSVLEDPIYAYDAEGVYNVVLQVTDSLNNWAFDTTTATIYPSCCFDVDIPNVFHLFYLTAEVTETCGMNHTNVPYTMKITGGVFYPPSPAIFTGTIGSIPANGVVPIRTDFMLGFGFIDIEITIDNCPPEYFDDGRIILIFILL